MVIPLRVLYTHFLHSYGSLLSLNTRMTLCPVLFNCFSNILKRYTLLFGSSIAICEKRLNRICLAKDI